MTAMNKKQRTLYIPITTKEFEEYRKAVRARKREETRLMNELEMGSGYIETNDDFRQGTRLDYSRVLQSDEDNLYWPSVRRTALMCANNSKTENDKT